MTAAQTPISRSAAGASHSSMQCIGCNRTDRPVRVKTPYGLACSACAPRYEPEERCDGCNKQSYRLARVFKLHPSNRYCPKCARKGAATCQACRRHRMLALDDDGLMKCKVCLEKGLIPCEICGETMPAGRRTECEPCGWTRAYQRRMKFLIESYESKHVRHLFAGFGDWLLHHCGPQKASLSLAKYVDFFFFFEPWSPAVPPYRALLEHFKAEGLRRVRLPMLWLKQSYGIEVDAQLREEHSEKRRIGEMLSALPPGVAAKSLEGYHKYLLTKLASESTSLRSVRLTLRAAVGLLMTTSSSFDSLPTQVSLHRYLIDTPGQAAALSGYVGYLQKSEGLELDATVSPRTLGRAKRLKLENQLLDMLRDGGSGEDFDRAWIKSALMFFHDVAKANLKTLCYERQSGQGLDGFGVDIAGQHYWVPVPSVAQDAIRALEPWTESPST